MGKKAPKSGKASVFPLSLGVERKEEFQIFAARQGRSGSDLLREAIDVFVGRRDAAWIRRPVWAAVDEWEEHRLEVAQIARDLRMLKHTMLDLQHAGAPLDGLDRALAKVERASKRADEILTW